MEVVVYGGEGCSACKALTKHLESKGVYYTYFDVYKDTEALEVLVNRNLRGIPQLFIDNEWKGGLKEAQKMF